MIEDLAFLYLDLPVFNTTDSLLERLERIVDESSFDDNFRNCRHIPIYVSGGDTLANGTARKWSKESDELPEIRAYIEKYVQPWAPDLGRIVVICTLPNQINPTHIDCSRKNFANNTLEHKFRVVIRGQTDSLYFNGKNKNYYISENLRNHPFIMSGCWPHTMKNSDSGIKFTLAMGSPWDADNSNKNYKDLIFTSHTKYKNSYLSKSNMKMPEKIDTYFSK
jgi:hypothetical protein